MSVGASYYLLTALPILAEPGALPPVSPRELRARAAGAPAAPLIDVILLEDDLRQRQGVLEGELADAEPAVLTLDQVRGDAPLPATLTVSMGHHPEDLPADRVWEAYWHHAARVARRGRSRFLGAWVRVEVGLRNALAAARAASLGRASEPHEVAVELGGEEAVVEQRLAAWAAATDPLAGWRALLRARWEWATREERSFSFSQDEAAAYAVKLLVLRDWRRTMGVAA